MFANDLGLCMGNFIFKLKMTDIKLEQYMLIKAVYLYDHSNVLKSKN